MFRISQPGSQEITDVATVEQIELVIRASKPGRYHVDG